MDVVDRYVAESNSFNDLKRKTAKDPSIRAGLARRIINTLGPFDRDNLIFGLTQEGLNPAQIEAANTALQNLRKIVQGSAEAVIFQNGP